MSDKVITKRLSKVARELNVGISTIVDFLSSKSISIESNPNTKIDNTTYEILSNEFQSEKSAKEESEKVTLPTNERAKISLDSKEEAPKVVEVEEEDEDDDDDDQGVLIKNVSPANVPAEAKKETPEVPAPEKTEPLKEEETPKPVEPVSKAIKIEEVPASDEDTGGPKVLGKINLDELNLKTRPDKKSKKDKEKDSAEAKRKAKEEADRLAKEESIRHKKS